MLTATYSLVAIAAEQNHTRSKLQRLQQYIQSTWKNLQSIDFGFFETALNKLMQFDKYCRGRKIEMYLIPALRDASSDAAALIAELDGVSASGMRILHSIREQMTAAFFAGHIRFGEICQAMDLYCRKLWIRLDREERELLPMARRLLSTDDWFTIAAQFLSDDGDAEGRRRHRPALRRPSGAIASASMDAR